MKVQSATEYLVTYGWAILIAAAAVVILYFYTSSSSALVPATCTMTFGAYCQDLAIGANFVGASAPSSGAWLFFTNSQQYVLVNPQIRINVSGVTSNTFSCVPANVLPAGAILCTVTLAQMVAPGTTVSGKLYFSAIPCQSGNALECASGQRQNYIGVFSTPVGSALSSTISPKVTLSTGSAPQVLVGAPVQLTATVTLPPSNSPIPGADVSFTSNSLYAVINPGNTTADGNGHALSQVSSAVVGTVTVTATFAGASASNTITFALSTSTSTT